MFTLCSSSKSRFLLLPAILLIILASVLSSNGIQVHGQQTDGTPLTGNINYDRPVLAFYYAWYQQTDWCSCHMSDLPTIR